MTKQDLIDLLVFLVAIVPASLFIHAVHVLFQEGNALEKAGEWITNRLGEYWSKPIINCPTCMASFWGTICFASIDYVFGVHLPWRQFIPYIMCLCGLNMIIGKFTTKERIIVDE